MLELLVSPETITVGRPALVTVGYVFQLMISLIIVVGLIYFSAKYLLPKLNLPSVGQTIQVKERIGLEPQVSAYIITAYGNSYIIIVSGKNVAMIDKIKNGT